MCRCCWRPYFLLAPVTSYSASISNYYCLLPCFVWTALLKRLFSFPTTQDHYSSQLNDLPWYTTEKLLVSGGAYFCAYLCQLDSEDFLGSSSTKGVQVLLKSHWLQNLYRGSPFDTYSCRKKGLSPLRNAWSKLTHYKFKIPIIVEEKLQFHRILHSLKYKFFIPIKEYSLEKVTKFIRIILIYFYVAF